MDLKEFFAQNPKAALGFSGGVDSSFLLHQALQNGARVGAYFVKTAFQPRFEFEDAQRLCRELGTELRVIELDILADTMVRANPADRCYWCKRTLFSALGRRAVEDGFPLLLDGTNASDDAGDRPGMRALKELSVRSPLRECGLTKGEIRERSKTAGLFTWDKPAYACLATRVPAGRALTAEDLAKIEESEIYLAGLGFRDFRVRLFGEGARIQVPEEQMPLAVERRKEIVENLDFPAVMLDLVAR